MTQNKKEQPLKKLDTSVPCEKNCPDRKYIERKVDSLRPKPQAPKGK